MAKQLITSEEFTSIQKAQAGLAKLFKRAARKGGFYRVLKNNRSLGVLIPDQTWASLLEDLEGLSSPGYLGMIERSRRSQKHYPARQVKKELGF